MTTSTVTNKIIDTANFKHLAIAEDAVDSVQFTIPKTYDGNDLSAGTVYSLWTIPGGSGDMTELTTTVSGDNLLSVWPLSGAVVSKKGMVEFQLVILVGTTIVWKTKIAYFFVDRKLDPTDLDFTPDVLTAHLASVIAARDRAETAANTAEGVLEDDEFQIVADDLALLEESLIKQVALNKTNIDLVATAKSNIDTLAPRASDMQTLAPQAAAIGTLAPVASAIAALDAIKAAISALDLIKSDITGVNGAKTDVSAVAAKLTELQAVYAKLTAIEALYGKTTEIDALYAELAQIASKLNASALVTSWQTTPDDTHVPSEKLVDTRFKTIEGRVDQSVKIASTPAFNGVSFPATQVPSADPNTLDDYEEGTWTPTLIGSTTAGTQTYTTQYGFYTKIGNLVTISGFVAISAKDGTMAGNTLVGGMPFAVKNVTGVYCAGFIRQYSGFTFGSGYTQLMIGSAASQSTLTLTLGGSAKSVGVITTAETADATSIIFSVTYQTA